MGQSSTGGTGGLAGARLLVVSAQDDQLARLTGAFVARGALVLGRDTYDEARLDLEDSLPDVVVAGAGEPTAEFLEALAQVADEVSLVFVDPAAPPEAGEALTIAAVSRVVGERRAADGAEPSTLERRSPGPSPAADADLSE